MSELASMPATSRFYVELAERIAARLRRPRVRALHLPPARSVARDAEFCAIELDDGSIGFAYVLLGGLEALLHTHDARTFAGMEAAALARGYAGSDPVAKAIGFATINALSQELMARAHWTPRATDDSLGESEPKRGEHIGMIGLFAPLVARVGETGARLTVLELKPELAADYDHYRVTLDATELASCDKIVSTCTVLLNDTLDAVLAACNAARHFAIIGPTAGCLPDPLFARGVGAIGGRRVVDGEGFRDAFASGGRWGRFAAKYVIARRDYPGVDWLLERAA